jgi:hypothetical protein
MTKWGGGCDMGRGNDRVEWDCHTGTFPPEADCRAGMTKGDNEDDGMEGDCFILSTRFAMTME